jgi:hypothetical protein
MEIIEVNPVDVLRSARNALGFNERGTILIDEPFLCEVLRRSLAHISPCSSSSLISRVLDTLQFLELDQSQLKERIERQVENLILGGDFLETSQSSISIASNSRWLHLASPTFIIRKSKTVYLFGSSKDGVIPLPQTLKSRIIYDGFIRHMKGESGENIGPILRDLGWLELSERTWMKTPKQILDKDFVQSLLTHLEEQPESGPMENLEIFQSKERSRNYSRRWKNPTNETGNFVCRRPQAYGAPIWGMCKVEDGITKKHLSFPYKYSPWRGCDQAWHIMLGVDSMEGMPQEIVVQEERESVKILFFSPIPMWAIRRLLLIGKPIPNASALYGFTVPVREFDSELEILKNNLWLSIKKEG